MDRPSREQVFLEIASSMAKRSTCLRRAVGCVLVNSRGHVLATGYNGVASGMPHCNEAATAIINGHREKLTLVSHPFACIGANAISGENLDKCEAIHAEQNALLQCRDVQAIEVCYVTVTPCIHCMKLLLNTGCDKIVYIEPYRAEAIELWQRAGRVIIQYPFQRSL